MSALLFFSGDEFRAHKDFWGFAATLSSKLALAVGDLQTCATTNRNFLSGRMRRSGGCVEHHFWHGRLPNNFAHESLAIAAR